MKSNASFSSCGSYRWTLIRVINESKKEIIFIGLNPSSANSKENDPTIRRLLSFAERWGFGKLYVINLFAKITKTPEMLKYCDDPVGSRNDLVLDQYIKYWMANELCQLWIGWGVNGRLMNRDVQVLKKIKNKYSKKLYTIGITRQGKPLHPLYVAKNKKLYPFPY